MIAVCGMNCSLCSAYLSLKNELKTKGIRIAYCSGCRIRDKKCAFIRKPCLLALKGKVKYCFECEDFPCDNLKTLDARYRKRYRMSMIENLEHIRDYGIGEFLQAQQEKWACPDCGDIVCCHNGICYSCGIEILKSKKRFHEWD
jgi:hypothetical protein